MLPGTSGSSLRRMPPPPLSEYVNRWYSPPPGMGKLGLNFQPRAASHHAFGPVTAVVTGWLVVGGRGPGGEFRRRYRFTDTWVKRGGLWQIVAAQDYIAS